MYCEKCGQEILDSAAFCGKCGAKVRNTSERGLHTAPKPVCDRLRELSW